MTRSLRLLVSVPVGWQVLSDFVKRITQFAASDKHQVALLWENSATRLDFSLSKIVAYAKRFNPDLTLRFDNDVLPTNQTIHEVADLCLSDIRSGFDLVFSPTRAVSGRVMTMLRPDSKENDVPDPMKCTEVWFGALGYCAFSPRLIEAWRPHIVEYGPPPKRYLGYALRQCRYLCTDWDEVRDLPLVETPWDRDAFRGLDQQVKDTERIVKVMERTQRNWERKVELAEVDPDLGTHTPLYVVNPPENSEDSDICFDVRENGFKIGCDPRLRGVHLKKSGFPNFGSQASDHEAYRRLMATPKTGTPPTSQLAERLMGAT